MDEVEVAENCVKTLNNFEYIGERIKGFSDPKNPCGDYAPGISHLVTDLVDEVQVDENGNGSKGVSGG